VSSWFRIRLLVLPLVSAACAAAPGDDVVAVFSRAARGAPLRYVAIGGSITEASGPGWIGDWLRDAFPESRVAAINSGMSGTGSSLGVFRLERDVLAHQPDLVAIEYCVNDGGLPDEDAARYLESMIVRLKSAPHPPAIVILEAAARTGVNLSRHRRVARHHDLLEVDFQAAVNAKLAAENLPWSALFGDDVHPKRAGHAFYAEVFRDALAPLARRAREDRPGTPAAPPALPAPLGSKPLLLDARLVPLHVRRESSGDWRHEPAPNTPWGRHFQGLLVAERPGAGLQIPFRGTAAGVFFALKKGEGSFLLNVDGRVPMPVFANTRDGFSSVVVENDLPPGEHVLNVVLPREASADPDFKTDGPVRLGYLLVAGETLAPRDAADRVDPARTAREGAFDADTLARLNFETIPARGWEWTGPFPVSALPDGNVPADAISAITVPFLPALERAPHAEHAGLDWKPVSAATAGGRVDFRAESGSSAPAVVYARRTWASPRACAALLWAEADYYAHLWLNGERVLALEGPHRLPVIRPVRLRAGENALLLKLGAGSAGFSARLRVATHE